MTTQQFIARLLDADPEHLRAAMKWMEIDDRGSAETELLFALGDPVPGNPPEVPPGKVCVRWATESGTEIDFDCKRVDAAIAEAARSWFPSNTSPKKMAMIVVVERDGEVMTIEEVEAKVADEFAVKRSMRDSRGDG